MDVSSLSDEWFADILSQYAALFIFLTASSEEEEVLNFDWNLSIFSFMDFTFVAVPKK